LPDGRDVESFDEFFPRVEPPLRLAFTATLGQGREKIGDGVN
jgi:hypothetical protein